MKYLILLLLLTGCASGMNIYRDKEGRVTKIRQTGLFPAKTKIGDAEIDTKASLLDINLNKVGN